MCLVCVGRPLGFTPTTAYTEGQVAVIAEIRAPRVVLGCLVGAGLAITGATVIQGLFRNPLADPGLIGVSSGAACRCDVNRVGKHLGFKG